MGQDNVCGFRIMKKTKHTNASVKKKDLNAPDRTTSKAADGSDRSTNSGSTSKTGSCPIDDDDQGFGGWLRSADGLDTMKLFVIANSIVMLTTIVFPHVQSTIQIIKDMIYGEPLDQFE